MRIYKPLTTMLLLASLTNGLPFTRPIRAATDEALAYIHAVRQILLDHAQAMRKITEL